MSFSELFFVKNKTYNRKKTMVVFFCAVLLISALFGRLVYLMIFDAAHYQKLAKDLHEREEKSKRQEERLLTEMELSWQRTGRYAQFP